MTKNRLPVIVQRYALNHLPRKGEIARPLGKNARLSKKISYGIKKNV
jgi:hypothetical protein